MSPALDAYVRAWRLWMAHEAALYEDEGVTEDDCFRLGHAADRAYQALTDDDLDDLARLTWPPMDVGDAG